MDERKQRNSRIAFVILAAGRGTRIGRVGGNLHKSLLPLDNKAVLTRLFELSPPGARLIVCVGDRANQLRDYVKLAHPGLDVTFVDVQNWKGPGSGPGRSLLAAREAVGSDDIVFTSCDTLWTNSSIWNDMSVSWAAYASIPAGTEPRRWCRLDVRNDEVVGILDKVDDASRVATVYVGLAYVRGVDAPAFWDGILDGKLIDDELQVTGGLREIEHLNARKIDWIDTGDESAYRRAVAQFSGYDWTKTNQATYILPESGRVVKYISDEHAVISRWTRGRELKSTVPTHVARIGRMLAYEYVVGETVYERLDRNDDIEITHRLLQWRDQFLRQRVDCTLEFVKKAVQRFYQSKTYVRISRLREPLRSQAYDAVNRVNFNDLIHNFEPGIPHGDLNYGNVIIKSDDTFVGIDWREDFSGSMWFDLRYDVAKLLAGAVVHWGRARRGDFTPWDAGEKHAGAIRQYLDINDYDVHSVEIIAALSLLNSAALHAEPLDEILTARGCVWLERLT